MDRLPDAVVALLPPNGLAVEVAAGTRFDLALDLAGRRPDVSVVVADVDPAVRTAPAPLRGLMVDIHREEAASRFAGAKLLFARRLPEELQVPAADLARRIGAAFAFRPLKDEVAEGVRATMVGGWRVVKP